MRPRGSSHADRRRTERNAELRRRRRRPLLPVTNVPDQTRQQQYDVDFPTFPPLQTSSSAAPSFTGAGAQISMQEPCSLLGATVAPPTTDAPSRLDVTSGQWPLLPSFSPSLPSSSRSRSEDGTHQHVLGCTLGRRQPTSPPSSNRRPRTMAELQEQLEMMRGLLNGYSTEGAPSISSATTATPAQASAEEDWFGILEDQTDVLIQPWARLPGGISRSDRSRRPMARTEATSKEASRQHDQTSKIAAFVYSVDEATTGSDVWPDIRDPAKVPATFIPLDMACRLSSIRSDMNDAGRERVDDVTTLSVWPMNELPSEIYYLIANALSRDDIKAMRLTCKEMEHHISGILFKNVVVPFNTEIYGMMHGVVDKKGKGKGKGKAKVDGTGFWKNSKDEDIYTGYGVDVFRSFGSSMKKFGMSFEVDEEVLASPPLKGTREDHKSYWGVYQWPFPEYKRFDQVAGLEDAADETPKMKTAFSFLNDVQELALSLDAGLGWLSGPDRSLRSRVLGERRPVFGDGHAVLDRKEEARQWLWRYLKEWAEGQNGIDLRHCTISKQSHRDTRHDSARPAMEPTYRALSPKPQWVEDDLDDSDDGEEPFMASVPSSLPTEYVSSSLFRLLMPQAPLTTSDALSSPNMDSSLIFRSASSAALDGSTAALGPSSPFPSSMSQSPLAMPSLPYLDLQGLVDSTAKPVPLLSLLENVNLREMLITRRHNPTVPEARESGFLFVEEDPVEPDRLEAYPIVPAELSKLQKEWLLETEWAQRAFLSSWLIAVVDNRPTFQHVRTVNLARMSSRFLLSLCRKDLWKALPQLDKVVLNVIPDCRDVVKDNAGFVETPRVYPIAAVWLLHKLVTEMIATRPTIRTLELGWAGGGERVQGLLARNKHLMPSPLLPPEWLGCADNMMDKRMLKERMLRLPYVQELTLRNCWSTPYGLELLVGDHSGLGVLRLESVSLTAEPVSAGANAQALLGAHGPGPVPQNASLMQGLLGSDPLSSRVGSWPHVLDIISPGGENENNVAIALQVIEIRSAGYCRLNNARLDETVIPAVYGGGTPWFAKRHAALSKVMLNGKGGVTAEIVQAIPLHEEQALRDLGLEMGWPQEWADEAEGCTFDGLLVGGTGRFSGALRRV